MNTDERRFHTNTSAFICGYSARACSSQPHRGAARLLAPLRRVHEREDFERFLVRNRRLPRLEEMHDLPDELVIAAPRLRWAHCNGVLSVHHGAIRTICAQRGNAPDATVFPTAGNFIGVRAGGARHFLASRAHERIEHLDGMDRIPREIELMV